MLGHWHQTACVSLFDKSLSDTLPQYDLVLLDSLTCEALTLPCKLCHFGFGHNQVGGVYQFKDISDLGNYIWLYQGKSSGKIEKTF